VGFFYFGFKDRFVTAAAWGDNIEVSYNTDNIIATKKVFTRYSKSAFGATGSFSGCNI